MVCVHATLIQWFPNFAGARTTKNIVVVRGAQNIELNNDSRTTLANLEGHLRSAEQTLGITAV